MDTTTVKEGIFWPNKRFSCKPVATLLLATYPTPRQQFPHHFPALRDGSYPDVVVDVHLPTLQSRFARSRLNTPICYISR